MWYILTVVFVFISLVIGFKMSTSIDKHIEKEVD